jgi:Methyltransferase TRM13
MASIRTNVDACILATCCHGVCTWQDYVGRDYLHRIMTTVDNTNTTTTTTAAAITASAVGGVATQQQQYKTSEASSTKPNS